MAAKQKYQPTDPPLNSHDAAAHIGMSHVWFKKNYRREGLMPTKIGKRTLRWRASLLNSYLDRKTASGAA